MAGHCAFTPVASFIIDGAPGSARAPFHEEFMMVEAAAHECSLEPRCRGFTLSASHMQKSYIKRTARLPRAHFALRHRLTRPAWPCGATTYSCEMTLHLCYV